MNKPKRGKERESYLIQSWFYDKNLEPSMADPLLAIFSTEKN